MPLATVGGERAPSGKPAANGFATVTMSGVIPVLLISKIFTGATESALFRQDEQCL
jgi:hypothetical protein